MFDKICQKYDNVNEIDALSGVTAKVESVKLVMQDNVEMALRNCVTLESIEKKAEELQTQAGVFKKTAKDIKNKMYVEPAERSEASEHAQGQPLGIFESHALR